MSENKENQPEVTEKKVPSKKPDDISGIHIEAKIKIFDPESGEVKVEGRA